MQVVIIKSNFKTLFHLILPTFFFIKAERLGLGNFVEGEKRYESKKKGGSI